MHSTHTQSTNPNIITECACMHACLPPHLPVRTRVQPHARVVPPDVSQRPGVQSQGPRVLVGKQVRPDACGVK